MYRGILNWISQFERKIWKLMVPSCCKPLQYFKAHPFPQLLSNSPRQRGKRLQECDFCNLRKGCYISVYEIHQGVMQHIPSKA